MSNESALESVIIGILLDPAVRESCSIHVEPWMFSKKVFELTVTNLLDVTFQGRFPDKKLFIATLRNKYPEELNAFDWRTIEELFDGFTEISDAEYPSAINIMQNFIKDRLIQKGADLFTKGRKVESEQYFTASTLLKITHNPFINPLEEGVMDRLWKNNMPPGGRVIKSSLGVVNTSLMYGGYKNGDLVLVGARPKAGKSMFLVQEGVTATDQDFNVCHMFFGDMTEFDGICMYCANITGDPLIEVIHNYKQYTKRCERWLDHLRIAAFPAMSMDCHEVVAHIRRLNRNFDINMAILDYDLNINVKGIHGKSEGGTMMYEGGGIMYSLFKGMADPKSENLVCLIASQTKQTFWGDEVPPMQAAAESSRKQQAVDAMLLLGRNQTFEGVGTLSMPLVRRGKSGEMARLRFEDNCRRVFDIKSAEYERIIDGNKTKKNEANDDSILEGISFSDRYREMSKQKETLQ